MFRAIYDFKLFTRILYVMFFKFGKMSLLANMMISVDGSVREKRCIAMGVCASLLMMISGGMGALHHPIWLPLKYAKWVGLIGVMVQVMAFLSTLV